MKKPKKGNAGRGKHSCRKTPVVKHGQTVKSRIPVSKYTDYSNVAEIHFMPADISGALKKLSPQEHLCLIYESVDECLETIIPFINIGIEQNDKCIYVADANTAGQVRAFFRRAGADIDKAEKSGQLAILNESQAYTRGGVFDPDKMIALLIEETEKALSDGYSALRVTGEMSWALRGYLGADRLMEYEAKLNRDFFPKYPCTALCQYDRRKFPPEIIKNAIMTHPAIACKNRIFRNLYYIPPEEYLGKNHTQRQVQHWLYNIEREYHNKERVNLLANVLECTSQPFMACLPDGAVITCNKALSAMTGYSGEELKTMRTGELLSLSSRKDKFTAMEQLRRTGQQQCFEGEYVCKNGTNLPVEIRVQFLYDDDAKPRYLLEFVTDLSELRQTAESLKESEKRFQMLSEAASEGIVVHDKGKILDVNSTLCKMLGYESSELVNTDGMKLLTPESAAVVAKAFASGMEKPYEAMCVKKDGNVFPVEITPRNILYHGNMVRVGAIRDIAERKKTEEKLKRQRDEIYAHARILGVILGTMDLNKRINLILDEVMAFLKTEFGCIHLEHGAENVARYCRGISGDFCHSIVSFLSENNSEKMKKDFILHEHFEEHKGMPAFIKAEHIQSLVSIPLYAPLMEGREREWFGSIIVYDRRYDMLDKDHIRWLNGIASQLSLAIDNAFMYREANERLVRLQTLRDIDKAIIQQLDIQNVLRVILERIPKKLGADAAAISLTDEAGLHTKIFAMRLPNGTFIDKEAFVLADSLLHWFTEQQKPVIIYDLEQDPRVQMHRDRIRNGRLTSYLGVPLIVNNKTIGILHILTTKPKIFADEDVGFFSTLAGQTAIAIAHALSNESLRETSNYLENLVNYANAPIIVWNTAFRIIRFNHAFERLTGYPENEIIGKELRSLFPPESCEESLDKITRTLSGEHWESVEIPILCKAGNIRIALWNSANIYAKDGVTLAATIAQGQDITERKKAEEAVRESEEKYRTMVEYSNDIIWALDEKGKFTYINKKGEDVSGFKMADWIGRDFSPLLRREDLPRIWDVFQKAMAGKTQHYEVDVTRADKSVFNLSVNTTPIFKSGKVTGTVSFGSDITGRKRAEEEKEKLQRQLLHSQKIEAVGTLAGGIAHDFNNILTAIQGYTDLLMCEVDEAHPFYRDLKQIHIATARASNITRQLLLFSRRQPMDFTVVNINRAVEDILKMLAHLIGENVVIETDLHKDLWSAMADVSNMEQVIMNLAINARDAMPEGGKITIKTENITLSDEQYAASDEMRPGKFVCISIADTGIGIKKELTPRIFEPFFTTKDPGKGTGLGLSVVYGIVKQHKGWINVYSEPGQGTIFKIYIPAFSGKAVERTAQPQIVPGKLKGNKERILLVEDEEIVCNFDEAVLKTNGYIVFKAHDAGEAMKIFRKEKGRFDLIFTDVVLPDKNGIQLAEYFLRKNPKLAVILCSGYTGQKLPKYLLKTRKYRFLQKPYSVSVLLQAVKESV